MVNRKQLEESVLHAMDVLSEESKDSVTKMLVDISKQKDDDIEKEIKTARQYKESLKTVFPKILSDYGIEVYGN